MLFREHLNPLKYDRNACNWNPTHCATPSFRRRRGMKYACLTTATMTATACGDVTEFVTRGRQTTNGNQCNLIIRFCDGDPQRVADWARSRGEDFDAFLK